MEVAQLHMPGNSRGTAATFRSLFRTIRDTGKFCAGEVAQLHMPATPGGTAATFRSLLISIRDRVTWFQMLLWAKKRFWHESIGGIGVLEPDHHDQATPPPPGGGGGFAQNVMF